MAEEIGRRLAPVPFAEHVVTARLARTSGRTAGRPRCRARRVRARDARTVADARRYPAARARGCGRRGGWWRSTRSSGDLVLIDESPPGAAVANLAGLPLAPRAAPRERRARARVGVGGGCRVRDRGRRVAGAARVDARGRGRRRALAGRRLREDPPPVRRAHRVVPGDPARARRAHRAARGRRLLVAAKAAWAADHDAVEAARLARMALLFSSELAQVVDGAGDALPRRLRRDGGVRPPALLPARQGVAGCSSATRRRSTSSSPTCSTERAATELAEREGR